MQITTMEMKKPKDISNLDEKIDAFKRKENARNKKATEPSSAHSAAKGFQMSIELLSAVFIGFCLGYFLDSSFQTKPLFLTVLTILGGFAGVLNIYKSAKGEN